MPKSIFESKPCGRCGGSGHYSYCQMYGTTCFQCRGSGEQLTKRGEAARAYLRSLLEVPVEQLQEGDIVEGAFLGTGKRVPVKVPPHQDESDPQYLVYETSECKHYAYPGTKIKRYNKDLILTAREQALVYQATLTKTGTLRKR